MSKTIAVLGAGMAGFGAAYALHEEGIKSTIYEARPRLGGHTSTHFYDDGFAFDEGPHISFTSDKRIQELFAQSVGGKFERFKAYVNNYWRGHWVKHPAQVNLHGLPPELIVSCINDFVEAAKVEDPQIRHYEDWLRAAFGNTFAETFPMEYTKKYHTTEAKNLTTDWLGPRLYRPKLEEMLLGALKPEPLDVHYVDDFRYPSNGGFVAYLSLFEPMADLRVGHKVVAIDTAARELTFQNNERVTYDSVVSSIPLPELIPLIKNAPKDVVEAAAMLSCSSVVLVNIGIKKPVESKAQWTYFYDEDISFTRLSYPSLFAASMAPEGCGSFQAEHYYSKKWKPLEATTESLIEPTINDLIRCGLIEKHEDVVHTSVIFAPYANIIFDYDRPKCLETVHGFLDDVGVGYCGRYGDWGYIWTDQAFKSGERAAAQALRGLQPEKT